MVIKVIIKEKNYFAFIKYKIFDKSLAKNSTLTNLSSNSEWRRLSNKVINKAKEIIFFS